MTPVTHSPAPSQAPSLAHCRQWLERWAGEWGGLGCYGLQDVCLLLQEALQGLDEAAVDADALAQIAALPACFADYGAGAEGAVERIMAVVGHAGLAVPLTDDERACLGAQLGAEQAAARHRPPAADDALNDGCADRPPEPAGRQTLALAGVLAMEAAAIADRLAAISPDRPALWPGQLDALGEHLQRYQQAAHAAGFGGLALACAQVYDNIAICRADPAWLTAAQIDALGEWAGLVGDYLNDPDDLGAGGRLVAQLAQPAWARPASGQTAAAMLACWRPAADGPEAPAPAKRVASADDVDLTLPDDVSRELLDILLHELPGQTQGLLEAMAALAAGEGAAALAKAQRIAHTIKGAANTVGITGIAVLTHGLEDILTALAERQRQPDRPLLDGLLAAADCLQAMGECLVGQAPPPADALAVLQTVLDWAWRIADQGVECVAAAPLPVAEAAGDHPGPPPAALDQASVRVEAAHLQALFRQAGENLVHNSQLGEQLRRAQQHLKAMADQFDRLRQLGDALERLLDTKDWAGHPGQQRGGQADPLEQDQYHALHTLVRQLLEAAFDARELNLDTGQALNLMARLLAEQRRAALDSQETLLETRLVPVSHLIPRLQRALRQTSRLTGKPCDLEVGGGHWRVDGDTLHGLLEPLTHLLRNAVDHGIEDAEARLAAGKPERGTIRVEFGLDGGDLVVSLGDDGQGLDYAAIRAAAERRGLLAAGQEADEQALRQLILTPNFSTRGQVTQTSGRGVGLDVVNAWMRSRGGGLSLRSLAGQGLTATLTMPLPLSHTHALLTQTGPYRLALAHKGVAQVVFVAPGQLATDADGSWLVLERQRHRALWLSQLLGVAAAPAAASASALLVKGGGQLTAVIVDRIDGSLDVVIKPLGDLVRNIDGVMGAAILGDGGVAAVIDLPGLIATDRSARPRSAQPQPPPDSPDYAGLPRALVVDDSLSQRRALAQLLGDAGYQVAMAGDGVEAVSQIGRDRPDLVLTDLEMPRMDGLELTAHIRARPDLGGLPVIMVTSRTGQAHRQLAQRAGVDLYLTKPVREEQLLPALHRLLAGRPATR